jgi:DNA-binding beta-propeller fold protein YncE
MNARWWTLRILGSRSVSSRRCVVVSTFVVFGLLGLSAAPTFALTTYRFDGQLAPPSGAFEGSLEGGSVAVNDFNGDAYVAEGNGVVDIFDSSRTQVGSLDSSTTPAGSFGGSSVPRVAANNATGEVYVLDPRDNVVDVFDATGTYLCQITGSSTPSASECNGPTGSATPAGGFSSPSGITVDQATGEVYVSDPRNSVVDIFSTSGAYLRQISLTSIPSGFEQEVGTVAVDDFNGRVYVPDSRPGVVYEFDAAGDYITTWTGSNTPEGSFGTVVSLAVDNATGTIYVTAEFEEHSATDVFDSSAEYVTQFSHSYDNPKGTAVDQASGNVYVSENGPTVVYILGPQITLPDVVTGSVSSLSLQSVTLNGTVNPDGAGPATCQFVWGTTTSFGNVAPCSEPVAEGKSPVAVHADLSGLQPDTTYHYRLEATNTSGTNPGEVAQDGEFTTPGPPVILNDSSSNVASASATLNAGIELHRVSTTYYFQYGTSTGYGADVPASPGVPLGSGENEVEVSQHLQGLSAGTTYHYRVVALSELVPGEPEAFYGVDQTFTTQTVSGGAMLPDGRAWEMVSPVDKHGAQIYAIGQYSGEGAVIQASAAGNAITYLTDAPTEAEPQGYTNLQQVLSTRGSGGWASRNIALPNSDGTGITVGSGEEYRFFSEDLLSSVVQPFGAFMPSLSTEASEQTAYLRTDFVNGNTDSPCVSSCYRPLVTGAPDYANVPPGTVFGKIEGGGGLFAYANGPKFLGATSDLSHIVLSSKVALASTSTGEVEGLYEWSAGKLALVSVLPGGEVATAGLVLGHNNENARNAISDDGSRIVWSEKEGFGEEHLYLRDMMRGVSGETVQLDTVQGGSGEGDVKPAFQVASSDGSKVSFTDGQKLTKDSGAQGRERPDLYECEIVVVADKLTCDLSDLTPLSSGESAGVQGGVIGASEDGSWIYFVANGVLAPGAVQGTCGGLPSTASSRSCNLYVRHDGVTSLVTVLSGADGPDWSGTLSSLTARVSPDGRWLAFMSERELTGYDNRDAVSGKLDEEVYLYDAESGRVTCASCDPTGARPAGSEYGSEQDTLYGGDRIWEKSTWLASNIPGWTPYELDAARYQSRYLSDSGRLFFNSDGALVPQDVNGSWDAYEYEPSGVGDCASSSVTFSERSDGCVGLISSGSSKGESAFLDASATGGDVFFLTSGKLLSEDRDTILDIYDAHECTSGSPCFAVPPVLPPPCDTGDSCKASPTPQPTIFGSPSSATFSGTGNVVLQGSKPAVQAKGLTRAQKLTRALKACQKKKGKRRTTCVRQAKAKYGAKNASKANATKKGRG